MVTTGKLLELANRNPIVSNGLQLHSSGAASLETAMVAIISALVEANERQQRVFFSVLEAKHPVQTYVSQLETSETQ